MTNFAEKTRPRIVLDLTIHREMFYRVDAYTQPFVLLRSQNFGHQTSVTLKKLL
jgi:hypothetical protein